MTFEVLQSKTIYHGRAFSVRQDQVRLPNGHSTHLDIVDHNQAVAIIPIDGDKQVWFVRQYRHPAGETLLELPAGVMEAGETPQASALREIREEIGMTAGELRQIGGVFLAPGYSTEYIHFFLATDLYPSPLPGDEDEFISIEKIPFDKAMILAESGQIRDAKSLVGLFWARFQL